MKTNIMLCQILAICAVAILWISTAIVQASPYLKVDTAAQAGVATNGGSYLELLYDTTVTQTAISGPLAQDTGSIETVNYANVQGTAQAKAQADYGVLRAWAHCTGCEQTTVGSELLIANGTATGFAEFFDTITISSPGASGSGTLIFNIHVDGSLTGIKLHPGVSGGAGWEIRLNDDYYHSVISWDYGTSSARNGGDFQLALPIVFNESADFSLSLAASASGFYYNILSIADYFNTVTITGLSVQNAFGNTLDTFTAVAGSGHDYTIPEPTTVCLLSIGALSLIRRKK